MLPPGGAANLLQLHPDHPVKWDAWDLDRSYRAKVTDLTHGEVTVDGDTVVVTHSFGESSATQRIRLVDDRVEIETEVDWHERERVLKAAFDVDVHTDHAAYETQFGHVVRPTHENTTWDAARFEVCAHRWVQVGDGGYGVGLANDATYGHDVTRHPRDGRRHVLAGAAQPAARAAVPRPGDRPGSARAAVRAGARRRRSRRPPRPGTR